MRRYRTLIIFLLIALSSSVVSAQSTGTNTIPYVYRIKIDGCKFAPTARRQTGFRVQGRVGVVTALHGVVGCQTISAVSDDGKEIFNDLNIRQVDIERDIALLSSAQLDGLSSDGLEKSVMTDAEIRIATLRIAGYPLGLEKQDIDKILSIRDIESLDAVIPDALEPKDFIKRKSPDLGIDVLNMQAHLLPGHSGAPILDSNNQVVGVGNGGLRDVANADERSWAIPWHDVDLQSVERTDIKQKLDELVLKDPSLAFSFSSAYPTLPTAGSAQSKFDGFVFDKGTEMPLRNAELTLTIKDGYGYRIAHTDSKGAFFFLLDADEASRLGELLIELQGYKSINYTLFNNKLPTDKIFLVALTPTPTPTPTRKPTPTPKPSILDRYPGLSKQPFELTTPLAGNEYGIIWGLKFNPNSNLLAAAGDDHYVHLWDVPSHRLVALQGNNSQSDYRGHTDRVRTVAFHPSGRWLASSGDDGTIRVWDLNNYNADPEVSQTYGGRSLAFYPDGKWLASAGGHLQLFQFTESLPHLSPGALYAGPDTYYSVAFSPDSNTMAAGTSDDKIEIRDFRKSSDPSYWTISDHEDLVLSVAYSPKDSNLLVSGSWDGTVRIWNLDQGGRQQHVFEMKSIEHQIWSIDVSSDGKTVASGGTDGNVYLWDLDNYEAKPVVLSHFTKWGGAVTFSPDGRYLAYTTDKAGIVRVYQLR